MAEKKAAEKAQTAVFSKRQLMQSKRFSGRKDALDAVLKDEKTYTIEQAERELDKFLKGLVK